MTDGLDLVPYDGGSAARVVGWCGASPFSSEWVPAGARDPDAVVAGWHADPDISGHLLLRDGTPVAYGELWVEADEDEAELAHLVVDPSQRRQGLGRELAARLVTAAHGQGLGQVFLRVRPDNAAATACYATAGFEPVSAAEETEFNAGQPAAYRWMRFAQAAGGPSLK